MYVSVCVIVSVCVCLSTFVSILEVIYLSALKMSFSGALVVLWILVLATGVQAPGGAHESN